MGVPVSIDDISRSAAKPSFVVMSPEGMMIKIPKELFMALHEFMDVHKNAGSMLVHFKNGGIAGLETMTKKTYK